MTVTPRDTVFTKQRGLESIGLHKQQGKSYMVALSGSDILQALSWLALLTMFRNQVTRLNVWFHA